VRAIADPDGADEKEQDNEERATEQPLHLAIAQRE
jgi:hypothetical protein